jgi:hypothetical protein
MKKYVVVLVFLQTLWGVAIDASPLSCECIGGYNPDLSPTQWYLVDYFGNPLQDGDCVCAYWVGPDGIVDGPDPVNPPEGLNDDVKLDCGQIEYGGFSLFVTTWDIGEGHPETGDVIYCVIFDDPYTNIGPSTYYGISQIHEVQHIADEVFYCTFPGDPSEDDYIPIELVSFEAIAGDEQVELRWETALETNCLGFYIERGDIRSDLINAAGNSDTPNYYSYLDMNLQNGVIYTYNLIVVDLDGVEMVANSEPVSATPMAKPMPIELTSFTATGGDGEILLQWRTATETDALGFYLERDGYRINSEIIPAFGNSAVESEYTYTDTNLENGITYSYNLIVLDVDGWEFVASDQPVSATPSPTVYMSLGPASPNPFSRYTSIYFTTPEDIHILIEVYDITGTRLVTLVDGIKPRGQYSIYWDASELPGGVYFCRMRAGIFDTTIELWYIQNSEIAQATNNKHKCFSLTQNYPNPFNPTTQIQYDIPEKSHVTLKIYNVRGREVITLVEDDITAGSYTETWNGRDNQGSEVSAGIYYCTMKAGIFSQTRKMVLLR